MAFGIDANQLLLAIEQHGGWMPEILPRFAIDDRLTSRIVVEVDELYGFLRVSG